MAVSLTHHLVGRCGGSEVQRACKRPGGAPRSAPVTILVEETADGTRVAYDTVSSALAIYPGGEAAMLAAQALDAEVLALLRHAIQA